MEEIRKPSKQITGSVLWKVFKRRWWIVLLVFVLASSCVGVVAYSTHREEYTATAKLWSFRSMTTDPSTDSSAETDYAYNLIALQNAQIGQQLVDAYREIMMTDEMLGRVINAYNMAPRDEGFGPRLQLSKSALRGMATISGTDSEMVFQLSITVAERPYDAELIANIWTEEFCAYVEDLMGGQKLVQPIDLPRVSASATETTPAIQGAARYSNPVSVPMILLIGLAITLLVYAVFLIRYISDDKINTPRDVQILLGLNLLGVIPTQAHLSEVKWVVYGEDPSDAVEFKK